MKHFTAKDVLQEKNTKDAAQRKPTFNNSTSAYKEMQDSLQRDAEMQAGGASVLQ